MSKVNLTDLVNLQNETTAVATINNNNDAIVTAMENTLSRDGTSPNKMAALIDMDSHRIVNLPGPIGTTEPVRLGDLNGLTVGPVTINAIPPGGLTGQILGKVSNTNYDVAWAPPAGVTAGTNINVAAGVVSTIAAPTFSGTVTGGNFSGPGTNLTGTAAGLTSGNTTTNANLTGPITSVGNTTSIASQTGTGTTFVMSQSPTLVTPALGTPSSVVLTNASGTAAALTAGTVTTNANLTGDVSSTGNATTIGANKVTNSMLSTAPAFTLKGNPTGSTANESDISIPALTLKASPVAADKIMIADSAASDALKYATVSSIGSAGSVSSVNGQTGALAFTIKPQGRLTLQTLTPVMSTTQAAKTTIYYTPYQGNQLPLYDGTNMIQTTFTEISVLTTDTTKNPAAIGASKVNDWFVWNDAGTLRLTHGPDWTNDTTRSGGTALVMVNGILLNSIAITNGPGASRGTYVGTTRSSAASQLNWVLGASGVAAILNVWNAYNRVQVSTTVNDSTASYTYTTAVVRQTNGSAVNQISYVMGLAEDAIVATFAQVIRLVAVAGAFVEAGIGVDSLVTRSRATAVQTPAALAAEFQAGCTQNVDPAIGAHFVASLEVGDGTNANTFFGQVYEGLTLTSHF